MDGVVPHEVWEPMVTMEKLYWVNNTAKARVLKELLSTREFQLVFDYGCGSGGEWPSVLAEHPHVRLIGYEPDAGRAAEAQGRLAPFGGKILSGNDLQDADFKADAIVSFSVFEHVYD